MSSLIEGKEYLAKFPEFKLVGRQNDLERLSAILLRSKANSVILSGMPGVGLSSLCLGIQASKNDPNFSFDIVSKRLFWLDTDTLFSSNNSQAIGEEFNRIISTLNVTSEAILVVNDAKDFIESARNNNCLHFANQLAVGMRDRRFQVILEAKDRDLEVIFNTNSDLRELFTILSLEEPSGQDLIDIVFDASKRLSQYHRIRIEDDAVHAAVELTSKYQTRDPGLSRAQPERSVTLIDRTFSSFRLDTHRNPPGFSPEAWETYQTSFKKFYRNYRNGETEIVRLNLEIADLEAKKSTIEDNSPKTFGSLVSINGMDTPEIRALKKERDEYQKAVDKDKAEFDRLTDEVNAKLILTKDLITAEFSKITGIPANKLNQNERVKLKSLEGNILKRIYGQNHAVNKLANAVKIARVGRRSKGEPEAAFIFMGPSGVGKTEIAKVLAFELLDDEKALTRFDMSEYSEKHAVSKLIGAPPGYEGFEAGGILTNAARSNPNRIYLFDEIEKGHPDTYNILLQILSDGRLTDNVGRVANFQNSIIIMTSNIGQEISLDLNLSTEEMERKMNEELAKTYRAEFLNRFAGRENIVCFHRLQLDSVEKIVDREFVSIKSAYSDRNINISKEDTHNFCKAVYNPVSGARGLPGYIKANIEPIIVNNILDNPDESGTLTIHYDVEQKKFNVEIDNQDLAKAA